jgi:hypothetical protein
MRWRGEMRRMDESKHRKLSIWNEIATWGTELPALLARILVAAKRADLPGRQKLQLEIIARRINMLFNGIGQTPPSEADDGALLEQLIQDTEMLRELITVANVTLDGLAKPAQEAVPQKPAVPMRDWRTSSHVDRPKR